MRSVASRDLKEGRSVGGSGRGRGSVIKAAIKLTCARPPFCRTICWHVAPKAPLVAVTFDDGPTRQWTPRVLDMLAETGTPATFFVQSNHIERCPDVFRRVAAAGHEIGNHGYDHSQHRMPEQIRRCERTLGEFGVRTRLFRPPDGLLSGPLLLWLVRSGYATVMWSLDARDSLRAEGKWRGEDPNYEAVAAGDIVLMHDDNAACVRDLPVLLEVIRRKHLMPVTVSQLIGLPSSRTP
jgi:peptidoglycan-N-acetylglucosamine deacetylase